MINIPIILVHLHVLSNLENRLRTFCVTVGSTSRLRHGVSSVMKEWSAFDTEAPCKSWFVARPEAVQDREVFIESITAYS